MESDYLTPTELAEWLKLPPRWLEKQLQARSIPGAIKAGRYWRFHRPTLERHLLGGVLLWPEESLGTKGRGRLSFKRLPRPSN